MSYTDELYALAATNGKKHALLLSNLTGQTQPLELNGVGLSDAHVYVIDQERMMSWSPNADRIENNMVMLIEWES